MDQKETLKPKAIAALKSLREAHIRPSPYMATRVLAHHKSQTRSPQSPFWKWLSISLATVLAVVVFKSQTEKPEQVYQVNQPYMIRVKLNELPIKPISYAVIQLKNQELRFSSKQFSAVNDLRELEISWESLAGKSYLPIVVRAQAPGTAEVDVTFYDSNNNAIHKKSINLNFRSI